MASKSNLSGHTSAALSLLGAKAEWFSLHNQRAEKIQEWQCLETQLFNHAKRAGVAVEVSLASDRPEAKAMKALDKQIAELGRRTDEIAANILSQPAESLVEAVAKIEVGLRMQGPEDWQTHALELVEGGLEALRKQLN